MGINHLIIKFNDDEKIAPRYNPLEHTQLSWDEAVITKCGTVNNRPIVDLVLTGDDGKKYYAMITGSPIQQLSAAISGAN